MFFSMLIITEIDRGCIQSQSQMLKILCAPVTRPNQTLIIVHLWRNALKCSVPGFVPNCRDNSADSGV